MSLNRGRTLLAIPGPSVIPDRVLAAMNRPSASIYDGELVDMVDELYVDLKSVARTDGLAAMYLANGHGAWEAAIRNTLNVGDSIVVLVNGFFSEKWGLIAENYGLKVQFITYDMQSAADPAELEQALRDDHAGEIKAVLAVQAETSSSVKNDIPALRKAIDAAGHHALFLVDCIASLGCDRFEMDAWGVDVMVSASQKGMMNPIGLAFVFFNEKADAASKGTKAGQYWDWTDRAKSKSFYPRFSGSPPAHQMFALRESLDMMVHEEGMEQIWARHQTIARAVWAATDVWSLGGQLQLNIADAGQRSSGVTTINTVPGVAKAIRSWCQREAGVTLGNSLGFPESEIDAHFRIGHMGHLNIHMIMGVLGAIEASMYANSIAHGDGALAAAARVLAAHPDSENL